MRQDELRDAYSSSSGISSSLQASAPSAQCKSGGAASCSESTGHVTPASPLLRAPARGLRCREPRQRLHTRRWQQARRRFPLRTHPHPHRRSHPNYRVHTPAPTAGARLSSQMENRHPPGLPGLGKQQQGGFWIRNTKVGAGCTAANPDTARKRESSGGLRG